MVPLRAKPGGQSMKKGFSDTFETKEIAPDVAGAPQRFVEGVSPSVTALEEVIRELASSDIPVLLMAEAGAGKKATAERIHLLSARRFDPFRVVACGQLPPETLDSQGADVLFNRATVIMQEIGNLDAACQQKLLGILPSGHHSGTSARLICGTVRDLEAEVRSGRFREDLYYRISGVSLRLPPLRQRKEDIGELLAYFLSKYAASFQRPVPPLSAETQQLFLEYTWPGNLRELEDVARAIVVLGDEALAMGGLKSLLLKSERGKLERVSLKEVAKAASREAERELILKVLNRMRWNRRRAARELQISYKALLYKLKQIGHGDTELPKFSQEKV
jgi:two-component system response regulator AtoC